MEEKKYIFQKLTPINQINLDIYREALDYVFENDDIKNIGISGAYCAGKSSVIETYKKLKPEIKFIHLSLSYFQSASKTGEKPVEQSENVLEGKILNQLIHQIAPINIPRTNFRVKRQISCKKLWLLSFFIALFGMFLVYIFNFETWVEYVETLSTKVLKTLLGFTTAPLFVFIAGIFCAVFFFYVVFNFIKVLYNKNLFMGISVQGNTIEIFEEKDESYFDKYLNEVIYLFENSCADAIVFEEMDRYNTNKIFQRLREINTLINNRKKTGDKPLRFFYLIRDDIFISKERTKFFDFILPIVPILDGSNSFDQFIEHFKQGNILNLFEKQFLQEISLYIDDMRILKNIYNEFLIYHKRISTTEQNPNKLLAVIIYKNIFPRDFSELQLNRGFVYTVVSKKEDLIKEEKNRLEDYIAKLKDEILASENEHLLNNQELNVVYEQKLQNLRRSFKKNSQIQALVKEKNTRKESIKNKMIEQQETLRLKISDLESAVLTLQKKKLHEIISKQNAEQIFKVTYTNEIDETFHFNEIKKSEYFSLIKYLIQKGYIDESYPDYMTYFYEYSLSRTDKIFLRSIIEEDAKEYTYQLKKPEIVLSRLNKTVFDNEEVLNFDLLDYIIEHPTDNSKEKMLKTLKQLRDKKNFKFISLYLECGKHIAHFIQALNTTWHAVFKDILSESNFTENQKQFYALESIYNTNYEVLKEINSDNILSDFVSNNKEFLSISNPNIQRIVDVFETLEIKFIDIDYEASHEELFQAVYLHNLYMLNFKMICLILREIYGCSDENALKHKNYTIVLSKTKQPLVRYINENINCYLESVIENCERSIEDSEDAIINLLNKEELEESLKTAYIDNLKISINRLTDVEDTTLWPKLITCNLVNYSEDNVLHYFCQNDKKIDKSLADFINNKGINFEYDYEEIEENFEEGDASKFFSEVVKNKELNIKSYASILRALQRPYMPFDIKDISESKMNVLIEQRIVTMTPEVLLFMREHYPENVVTFIKYNIHKYLEIISEDNFDYDEMLEVLSSDVADKYKYALLEFNEHPISINSDVYSEELKIYILKNNFNQEDFPQLIEDYLALTGKMKSIVENIAVTHIDDIIENKLLLPLQLCMHLFECTSIHSDKKLQLFAMTVNNFNESECKECLVALDFKDYLSVFSGKRPTIPVSEIHSQILEIFSKKQWISSYGFDKKDNNLYRVNSKRV